MPVQSDFPDVWQCESEHKSVRVELRVPSAGGDTAVSWDVEVSPPTADDETITVTASEDVDVDSILVTIPMTIDEIPVDGLSNDVEIIARWRMFAPGLGGEAFTQRGSTFEFSVADVGGFSWEYADGVDGDPLGDVDVVDLLRNANEDPDFHWHEFHTDDATVQSEVDTDPGVAEYDWIEIPTSSVELYVEKGEAADIQRTAKVEHPTVWGRDDATVNHNSPRRLVTKYSSDDSEPFMLARVSFQRDDGEWVYTHLGWVGGTGAAGGGEADYANGDAGVSSKFWVYDFAELLTGVPLSVTFNYPNLRQAASKTAELTNNNTPTPVESVTIFGVDVEEETAVTAERVEDERERVTSEAATYYSRSDGGQNETEARRERYAASYAAYGVTDEADQDLGSKTFVSNHDTLLDVYDWVRKKSDSNLHFEPTPDGNAVELVVDVNPSRRTFTQTAVVDEALDGEDYFEDATTYHEPVDVLKNNALYELKPKNTVYLNGKTGRSSLDEFIGDTAETLQDLGLIDFEQPSEKYPSVKVQAPPLLDATDGVELAPELIESDATTLASAEREARRELREMVEEPSEGEIVLRGVPQLRPYDRVRAFEVCNDTVVVEDEPVEYEVESAKHVKQSDGEYTVSCRVSIWIGDEHIETVEREMVEV